jgi:uncharacterized protein YcfJ
MKHQLFTLITVAALATGCNTTQRHIGTGAAPGAVIGGVIGHNDDGHGAEGALIGTIVGGLAGAAVDEYKRAKASTPVPCPHTHTCPHTHVHSHPGPKTVTVNTQKTIVVRKEVAVHVDDKGREYYFHPETGRKTFVKAVR